MKKAERPALMERLFSTAAAAEILGVPLETFRTQLKKGWLPAPYDADRENEGRRTFNADDLLRCRVAAVLARKYRAEDAAKLARRSLIDMFAVEGYCFVVVWERLDGAIDFAHPCLYRANEIQEIANGFSGVGDTPNPYAVVQVFDLNAQRAWVLRQIGRFLHVNAFMDAEQRLRESMADQAGGAIVKEDQE